MKRTLLALALVALPFSAFAADELKYSYVEADYVDLDHGADGPALRGSLELGKSGAYLTGSYAWLDAGANVRAHELGAGYHHGIGARTDLIGEVAYRKAEADGASAEGARASVGVRGALGKRGEAFVKGNYYDAADFHGDATGTVGGQFKFNDTWGVTAEVEAGNGDTAWLAGVRASFK